MKTTITSVKQKLEASISQLNEASWMFSKNRGLFYTGQKIALSKGYFLSAFHGGRIFNIETVKTLWMLCGYFLLFCLRAAKKQDQ